LQCFSVCTDFERDGFRGVESRVIPEGLFFSLRKKARPGQG